ncbi:MAG: fluoride efflux transporter CrcB [Candidatus Bathyarchaeota archaeon]|nr:fluoride efflux transporter CrcB [Candidatus Bathyarchaeota archaeon]
MQTTKGIELVLLAVGAVIGAVLRYRIGCSDVVVAGLCVNVLIVNVIGSFVLGLFSVFSPALNLHANFALFVAVGFCGSLTSMSSFALDTSNLLDNNSFNLAVLNILSNVGLSLGALISSRAIGTVIIENLLH